MKKETNREPVSSFKYDDYTDVEEKKIIGVAALFMSIDVEYHDQSGPGAHSEKIRKVILPQFLVAAVLKTPSTLHSIWPIWLFPPSVLSLLAPAALPFLRIVFISFMFLLESAPSIPLLPSPRRRH